MSDTVAHMGVTVQGAVGGGLLTYITSSQKKMRPYP